MIIQQSKNSSIAAEPTVSCGAESVSIDLQTSRAFSGRIFVKGYSQDPNCALQGSGAKVHGFSINFDQVSLSAKDIGAGVTSVLSLWHCAQLAEFAI